MGGSFLLVVARWHGTRVRSGARHRCVQPSPRWTTPTWSSEGDGYLDADELLVHRRSVMAFRVALRLCGRHHDAQDIAEEALIAPGCTSPSSGRLVVFHLAVPDPHRRTLNKIIRGRRRGFPGPARRSGRSGRQARRSAERNLAVDAVTDALAALPFPPAGHDRPTPPRRTVLRRGRRGDPSTGLQTVTVNGTIDDVLTDDADGR